MSEPALHVRRMRPPVVEEVDEVREVRVSVPGERFFSRDPKSGVLILEGQTEAVETVELVPTGSRVKAKTQTRPDGTKVAPSLTAVDLACEDCGRDLVAAGDRSFHYLACARIDTRDHGAESRESRYVRVRREVPVPGVEPPRLMLAEVYVLFPAPPVGEGDVLECGGVV